MKLSFAIIAVAFAAALLLAGCAGAPDMPPSPPTGDAPNVPGTQPEPIACSADAKVCPDGTMVGRTGPNCEFAACPEPRPEMTQKLCEATRGYWNECASACWDKPEAEICTLQCVQLCVCGGESNWKCPTGYWCYVPKNPRVFDQPGGCMPNAPSLQELAASPEKYVNKSIALVGTLRLEGSLFGGSPKFFLDDGSSSVRALAWAPFSVSDCAPGVSNCKPPRAISYYIGKRVQVNGTIVDIGDSKKAEYAFKADKAEVVGELGTGAMTKELCESARGSYGVNAFGEGSCSCGGFAGFGCPEGYDCAYSEQGYDVMGACVRKA